MRLHQVSKLLVAALLPLTTHKRHRVRIAAMRALTPIMHQVKGTPHSPWTSFDMSAGAQHRVYPCDECGKPLFKHYQGCLLYMGVLLILGGVYLFALI
jgi:hypothetical protein